jgi:archaellum component FlaC
MINDMKQKSEGASEEQAILDKEVEELRYKIREIYHEVRSVSSEARMQAIR